MTTKTLDADQIIKRATPITDQHALRNPAVRASRSDADRARAPASAKRALTT